MPDPEPTLDAPRSAEWIVLDLLLERDEQRPWSVEELAREVGQPTAVADALNALYGAGLIHRTSDGFVFVTRAAARFHEIAQ
jgi:predicted transcriptional regulator